MERNRNIFILLTTFLNVAFFGSWIYSFNKFSTHVERVDFFDNTLFLGLSSIVELVLIGATLISIYFVFGKTSNRLVKAVSTPVNTIFLLLVLWSHL